MNLYQTMQTVVKELVSSNPQSQKEALEKRENIRIAGELAQYRRTGNITHITDPQIKNYLKESSYYMAEVQDHLSRLPDGFLPKTHNPDDTPFSILLKNFESVGKTLGSLKLEGDKSLYREMLQYFLSGQITDFASLAENPRLQMKTPELPYTPGMGRCAVAAFLTKPALDALQQSNHELWQQFQNFIDRQVSFNEAAASYVGTGEHTKVKKEDELKAVLLNYYKGEITKAGLPDGFEADIGHFIQMRYPVECDAEHPMKIALQQEGARPRKSSMRKSQSVEVPQLTAEDRKTPRPRKVSVRVTEVEETQDHTVPHPAAPHSEDKTKRDSKRLGVPVVLTDENPPPMKKSPSNKRVSMQLPERLEFENPADSKSKKKPKLSWTSKAVPPRILTHLRENTAPDPDGGEFPEGYEELMKPIEQIMHEEEAFSMEETSSREETSAMEERSAEVPAKLILPAVNNYYSYYCTTKETARWHFFEAKIEDKDLKESLELKDPEALNCTGDRLKSRILNALHAEINALESLDDMETYRKQLTKDPRYLLLAEGQGIATRLFKLETDSIKALNKMLVEKTGRLNRAVEENAVVDSPEMSA